ncbi:hypothetical protein P4O66_009958 [Electrophorus voltai]|uniref:Large ribosomal subunit protein mL51 n=1 Tax=Electrophorus voltai TaxID=2609070 RepID=A0AAD8Z922_9TELE|nr:hypothetical protein P4O66_009958 [Electrophorus voltai]
MDLQLPESRLDLDVDLGFALFFFFLLCLFLLGTIVRCAQLVLDPYRLEYPSVSPRYCYARDSSLQVSAVGTCLCVRMHAIPKLKNVDRWTEKRSMFGVYDNIGILGDFKAHPKDLITGPVWLRGFRGHELQRLTRKKQMVGDRMMLQDRHNLAKRISFLYRRFNRYGKRR